MLVPPVIPPLPFTLSCISNCILLALRRWQRWGRQRWRWRQWLSPRAAGYWGGGMGKEQGHGGWVLRGKGAGEKEAKSAFQLAETWSRDVWGEGEKLARLCTAARQTPEDLPHSRGRAGDREQVKEKAESETRRDRDQSQCPKRCHQYHSHLSSALSSLQAHVTDGTLRLREVRRNAPHPMAQAKGVSRGGAGPQNFQVQPSTTEGEHGGH